MTCGATQLKRVYLYGFLVIPSILIPNIDFFRHHFRTARPLQCGGTGKYKLLEMRNPASVPTECVYKIQPLNMNVCQIRVDFDAILQQPEIPKATEKGVPKCVSDTFTIAGLELCGNNQNQHGITAHSR